MTDPNKDPTVYIHPKAEVHSDCQVGAGTRIWQFASVLRGAKLGKDCNVASGACIDGSEAGDGTIISHNFAAGPGFKIGNHVFIAPNVTFCNDLWPWADKEGFEPKKFDGTRWAIIVNDRAIIGSNAAILPGVVIGGGAVVAAGSVVSKDVPEGMIWKRDGTLAKVPPGTRRHRMRFARETTIA